MAGAMIVTFIIYLIGAAIMIGIGISQLRSSSPVGFYSGEKPPEKEELTDVPAWNRKHGMMWLIYGMIILLTSVVGYLMGDSIFCMIPYFGGIILPLFVMIWYHHKLIKTYKR